MELVVDPTPVNTNNNAVEAEEDEEDKIAKQTVRMIMWALIVVFLVGFVFTGYYHYCQYAPDATLCLYTSGESRTTVDQALSPLTLVVLGICVFVVDAQRRRRERLRKNI